MNAVAGKYLQQLIFFISTCILLLQLWVGSLFHVLLWIGVGIILMSIVISAFYHRYLTHRSWECPRSLEIILALTAAGHACTPAISWVAVHRKHHRYSDTPNDPHGPGRGVIKTALIAFYDSELKYATSRLLKDPLYQFQLKHYFLIMFGYFICWSIIFGPISWCIINAYAYVGQAFVNYVAHYRNKPTNIPLVSLFLAGETYHEHHHRNPSDPKFGTLDIPYWFIVWVRWLIGLKRT